MLCWSSVRLVMGSCCYYLSYDQPDAWVMDESRCYKGRMCQQDNDPEDYFPHREDRVPQVCCTFLATTSDLCRTVAAVGQSAVIQQLR